MTATARPGSISATISARSSVTLMFAPGYSRRSSFRICETCSPVIWFSVHRKVPIVRLSWEPLKFMIMPCSEFRRRVIADLLPSQSQPKRQPALLEPQALPKVLYSADAHVGRCDDPSCAASFHIGGISSERLATHR